MRGIVLLMITGYRRMISPYLGPSCRFVPSCSEYASEAIQRHGLVKGGMLACRRILRCHPLGGDGVDPVPEAISATPLTTPPETPKQRPSQNG